MGYTHYFNIKDSYKLPISKSKKMQKEIQSVLDQHSSIIQLEYNVKGKPINDIDENGVNLVQFNGISDEGHETFYFKCTTGGFNFCKTARKKYDIVVCKVLLIMYSYFKGNISLRSDGFPNQDDYIGDSSILSEVWLDAFNELT